MLGFITYIQMEGNSTVRQLKEDSGREQYSKTVKEDSSQSWYMLCAGV